MDTRASKERRRGGGGGGVTGGGGAGGEACDGALLLGSLHPPPPLAAAPDHADAPSQGGGREGVGAGDGGSAGRADRPRDGSGQPPAVAVGGLPPAPAPAPDDDAADAPGELLGPLLEWGDVLRNVLAWLDPVDVSMLAQVGKPCLAAVVGLPRAGKGGEGPFKLENFFGSIEMLAWAKANGCTWDEGQGLTLGPLFSST